MEGNGMQSLKSLKGKPITCKAAVCWSAGEPLVIEEIQVAPPQASEVRIKIICTTLCHSDFGFWNNKEWAKPLPRIFGHEAVGTVESVGEDVKDVEEGDLVIPIFVGECGECVDCKSERSNLCVNVPLSADGVMRSDKTSRFSVNGKPAYHFMSVSSFSEYTVVDVGNVVKPNPAIPPAKACLLSCAVSTGVGAAWKVAKVEKGSTIAIFGLGTVGLAVAEGARMKGASRIIGVDLNKDKFKIAKKFGVTETVNPKDYDKPVHQVIKEMTGGGVDYSFECVGDVGVCREAFESCRSGWGTTIVLGVEMKNQEMPVSYRSLLPGRSVKGSLFGGLKPKSDIPILVDMYLKNELHLDGFISHELSFLDINKAFDLMAEGKGLRCIMWMERPKHKFNGECL